MRIPWEPRDNEWPGIVQEKERLPEAWRLFRLQLPGVAKAGSAEVT